MRKAVRAGFDFRMRPRPSRRCGHATDAIERRRRLGALQHRAQRIKTAEQQPVGTHCACVQQLETVTDDDHRRDVQRAHRRRAPIHARPPNAAAVERARVAGIVFEERDRHFDHSFDQRRLEQRLGALDAAVAAEIRLVVACVETACRGCAARAGCRCSRRSCRRGRRSGAGRRRAPTPQPPSRANGVDRRNGNPQMFSPRRPPTGSSSIHSATRCAGGVGLRARPRGSGRPPASECRRRRHTAHSASTKNTPLGRARSGDPSDSRCPSRRRRDLPNTVTARFSCGLSPRW